jgi:hypothetical protein
MLLQSKGVELPKGRKGMMEALQSKYAKVKEKRARFLKTNDAVSLNTFLTPSNYLRI